MSRLSVAIITYNEEEILEQALKSASFADEIVVVDSGSTDATVRIAEWHGARVIHNDWPGFGAQKNLAMEHCTGDWIFVLDADECITPELAEEVQQVIRGTITGFDAYSIPRKSQFIDRFMRWGGWYPDRQLRLVRKGAGRYSLRPVHECIECEGPVGKLQGDLLHYSYASVSDYIERMNRYSSLSAEVTLAGLEGRQARFGSFFLAGKLAAKFLEVYILKRGFLEGRHGFVVSCLAAFGLFLRYCKVVWPEDGK